MRKDIRWSTAGLVLSATLVLWGCSSTGAVLEEWVGAPKTELLQRWGKPTEIRKSADGGTLIAYKTKWEATIPSGITSGSPTGGPASAPLPRTGFETVERWCHTQFQLSKDGTVTGYKYKGNDCKPKKRR